MNILLTLIQAGLLDSATRAYNIENRAGGEDIVRNIVIRKLKELPSNNKLAYLLRAFDLIIEEALVKPTTGDPVPPLLSAIRVYDKLAYHKLTPKYNDVLGSLTDLYVKLAFGNRNKQRRITTINELTSIRWVLRQCINIENRQPVVWYAYPSKSFLACGEPRKIIYYDDVLNAKELTEEQIQNTMELLRNMSYSYSGEVCYRLQALVDGYYNIEVSTATYYHRKLTQAGQDKLNIKYKQVAAKGNVYIRGLVAQGITYHVAVKSARSKFKEYDEYKTLGDKLWANFKQLKGK